MPKSTNDHKKIADWKFNEGFLCFFRRKLRAEKKFVTLKVMFPLQKKLSPPKWFLIYGLSSRRKRQKDDKKVARKFRWEKKSLCLLLLFAFRMCMRHTFFHSFLA